MIVTGLILFSLIYEWKGVKIIEASLVSKSIHIIIIIIISHKKESPNRHVFILEPI